MAFGIDFTLDTNIVETFTTTGFVVTDQNSDYENLELTIAFDRLDENRQKMNREMAITIDGAEANAAFVRADALADQFNETLVRALYYVCNEIVRDYLGLQGTINR